LPSRARRFQINFLEDKVAIRAELLEEDAPATCDVIWNALPLRTKAIHDIWSGHQLFVHLEPMIKLPAENLLTYLPKVGDIFYYYRPPHYFRGAPYGRIEDAELGFVYARDSRPQGPRGPKAVNIFASVFPSDLELFKKVGEKILYEGAKDIELTRA
jgi:hypothetical protein